MGGFRDSKKVFLDRLVELIARSSESQFLVDVRDEYVRYYRHQPPFHLIEYNLFSSKDGKPAGKSMLKEDDRAYVEDDDDLSLPYAKDLYNEAEKILRRHSIVVDSRLLPGDIYHVNNLVGYGKGKAAFEIHRHERKKQP